MRSLGQLVASGLSNLPDNPTSLPDGNDDPSSGSDVGSAPSTRRQQTPYLGRILWQSSGSSGFVRRYERGYPGGEWEDGLQEVVLWRCRRHGARSGQGRLRVLKM
jgi:hypothetical protein